MDDPDLKALRIVRDALDIEPAERDAFLSRHCGVDSGLRTRVDEMLRDIDDDEARRSAASPPSADNDVLVGLGLGPFRVVERIGRGGMGVVYRGERIDADFVQTVAIKLIRRGFDFDDVQARFLRERRILARLSHPNLARLVDGGVAPDGRPWFALDFVDGDIITRWCDAHRLDVRQRARLFLDVCAAVQYAHGQLVVHRDLKPGNILVDADGTVRLLDFGIAHLLEGNDDANATLTTLGSGYTLTPEYAAPEQFERAPVGVATDVYALGVILYELVSGIGPYVLDRTDMAAVERAVRESEPQAPAQAIAREAQGKTDPAARLDMRRTGLKAFRTTVRGDLSRILGKALAKEPERRYATVQAFAEDLSRWLDGHPVHASGNRLGYRIGKFVRRNRVAVAVASGLVLCLAAAIVLALRSAWNERIQREAAVAEAARIAAVRDYTLLMFREAGEQGNGTRTSARDVLHRGADKVLTRFADKPEEGQEIAVNLADLYMQLGDVEGASALLERLVAWPGIEANPDVLARARYNLAQVDYMRGNAARAREMLDAAQAYWQTRPQRYALILNESRIIQAQLERAERRFDPAIATLETAIAERRRLVGDDREVVSALNALMLVLIDVGRHEEAVAKADEALRISSQESESVRLGLVNNRATAKVHLKHYDEAIQDFRQVVEMRRKLFGRSPELAAALVSLAVTMARSAVGDDPQEQLPKLRETIPLIEESYAIASEFGGEAGRITMIARPVLAETYARVGRVDEAAPLADASVRVAQASFGDANAFTGIALRARAWVRVARNRDTEARADIAEAKAVFARLGKGGEVYLPSLAQLEAALDARTPR